MIDGNGLECTVAGDHFAVDAGGGGIQACTEDGVSEWVDS